MTFVSPRMAFCINLTSQVRLFSLLSSRLSKLTHVDKSGEANMVDVTEKDSTLRIAVARGRIRMNKETFTLLKEDKLKKGNVLTVAQIAGIQGAKSCSQLIPLCHPLSLTKVAVDFKLKENLDDPLSCAVEIESLTKCKGETGVEMEALSAVSVAALTIFDMCKAASKDMRIEDIRVVEKSGGKSGHWKGE